MELLLYLVLLLGAGAIFLLENAIIGKLAYPLDRRYFHCRTIVAVALSGLLLANVYILPTLLSRVNDIINSPSLARFFSVVLPHRNYALLYMVLAVLLLNLLFMTAELLLIAFLRLFFLPAKKYVQLSDCGFTGRVLHLPWMIANRFYKETDDVVYLTPEGYTVGIWAKGMKRAFAILLCAEILGASVFLIWGPETLSDTVFLVMKACSLLPMAGYLVAQQVEFCFSGCTETEASHFSADSAEESLSCDMDVLYRHYLALTKDSGALLHGRRGQPTSVIGRLGLGGADVGHAVLEECEQSDVLEILSNQLRACGAGGNSEYRHALAALLNGRHVNICDNIRGEFLIYLVTYLNYYLSLGKTVLVLCGSAQSEKEMKVALEQKMKRLNHGICNPWSIRTSDGVDDDAALHVLICTCEEFINCRVREKQPDFTNHLFCAVLADSFSLLSADSMSQARIFNALSHISGLKQYIFLSEEDNNDLRTAAESRLGKEKKGRKEREKDILAFRGDKEQPDTYIMAWKAESVYRIQQCLGIASESFYMGVGIPLALVGLEVDLDSTFIIPDEDTAYLNYLEIAERHSTEISRYIRRTIDIERLKNLCTDKAMEPREVSMLILYDAKCNMFQVLRRWMKYSGNTQSLIHLVCPPYLLREYFADKFDELLYKPGVFDAAVPHDTGTKQMRLCSLLVDLCNGGMTESELRKKNDEYGWEYANVSDLLRDCLRLVLRREELHDVMEYFLVEDGCGDEEDGFERADDRFILNDHGIRDRLEKERGFAELVLNDGSCILLPILKDNVKNYYLREQLITANGYFYVVNAIRDGKLYADQQPPIDVPQYYQLCHFSFADWQESDRCTDSADIDYNIGTACVTRTVTGYLSCNAGNDFWHDGGVMEYKTEPECLGGEEDRRYQILQMRFSRERLGDEAEKAATLFAFALRELCKTLFPDTWQNLYVVTAFENKEPADGFEKRVLSVIPYAEKPIIDAATGVSDAEDPVFVTVYAVEFSGAEYGMVKMLYADRRRIFKILCEYLSWYLEKPEDTEVAEGTDGTDRREEDDRVMKGTYLHFGAPEIPSIFAIEPLLYFCRRQCPESEKAPDAPAEPIPMMTKRCTFCYRPVLATYDLSDGRRMCSDCHDHKVDGREAILDLFKETKDLMMESYRLLPGALYENRLHVKFRPADAIRRATGGSDDGRVLGFYSDKTKQLWIEGQGPMVSMRGTLIHELTHAWQHRNLDLNALKEHLGTTKKEREERLLILLEGHATYVEICTMRRLHETAYADEMDAYRRSCDDEYGMGYRAVYGYLKELEETDSTNNPLAGMKVLADAFIRGEKPIVW